MILLWLCVESNVFAPLSQGDDFEYGYNFGCFVCRVFNVFVVKSLGFESERPNFLMRVQTVHVSVVLLISKLKQVLHSMGSEEKSVILPQLRMRLFNLVHAWMLCRYECMYASALCMLLCVALIVMSSAYVMN